MAVIQTLLRNHWPRVAGVVLGAIGGYAWYRQASQPAVAGTVGSNITLSGGAPNTLDGVTLHARPLGDHADGRPRGTYRPMQIEGRLDNAAPRCGLLLRAALQGVGPRHLF